MKNNFIPVNIPLIKGNELKYLKKCIYTGWISSEGGYVKEFEKKFCRSVNRKYGISVSSGTAALDIAVDSIGISKGDEVILPASVIISCVNQIVRLGAKPVLVDLKKDTLNMDPDEVLSKVNKRTKAIMITHLYGLPVDLDPILKIAKKKKIIIIEDAAEMYGQNYKSLPCGSFGLVSTFSFYANKQITTGEGGMIVTNNKKIAKKCSELRNLCFKKNRRFVHYQIGWNYRMSNIQAALGVAQLERINEIVKLKRKIGNFYNKKLKNIEKISLPIRKVNYAYNIYWVYTIILKKKYKVTAEYVCKKLLQKGIQTRRLFYPLNKQPVLKKYNFFMNKKFPNAEYLYKYGFYIPSGLGINEKDQEKVCKNLIEILKTK